MVNPGWAVAMVSPVNLAWEAVTANLGWVEAMASLAMDNQERNRGLEAVTASLDRAGVMDSPAWEAATASLECQRVREDMVPQKAIEPVRS